MSDTITFVVPGTIRAAAAPQRLQATIDRDVVRLEIANGPVLILNPETARDLLLAQSGAQAAPRGGGAVAAPDAVQVPVQLRWKGLDQAAEARGASRGLIGDVLLSGFQVLAGGHAADELAAGKIVEHFDASVKPGLYRLQPTALVALDPATTERVDSIDAATAKRGPLLVLVHGTFSSTRGTFDKLWQEHPQLVRDLFAHYGDRVYALEHPTLGASPSENALALARALPPQATVHLLTHSRGGLVAEVFARACAARAFTDEDRGYFAGADYDREREVLEELAGLARDRQIEVGRVVRVACPARGTLLASKRLDAYLSVLKWTLELAHIPVAPELVDFLGKVAQRRTDPKEIPGLAAQIPDSPLVRWLHAAPVPIAGDLRVVAGDMEGDSIGTWVKTLLADAYYWMDNDLVVQTRSMYGGAPRAAGATFLLDRGGQVSHFSYFANEITANAIVAALKDVAPPLEFRAIGPLSWQGRDDSGVRAPREADTGDKPAVILLPGIVGSNLAVDGKRVWLDWRIVNGLGRLAYDPEHPDRVMPDGPIADTYAKLSAWLARSHHVIELAYDWRLPMEESARLLADAVLEALRARQQSGQPVRIIAHSMGGLLARTMQLEHPEAWERMMANRGARFLMLGTPNAGSWAPMQVLSGDDDFGNMLSIVGMPFRDEEARQLMASFPGFMQLQAALVEQGLDSHERWADLAARDVQSLEDINWWHHDELQVAVYRWGVPSQEVLARAVALRRRLDIQRDELLARFADRMALVVGRSAFTPDGCEMTPQGLVYVNARDGGDGRVPLENALLPGVRAWKLDCEHGDLPRHEAAFEAYVELLETGATDKLEALASPRGATVPERALVVRSRARPSRSTGVSRPPQDRSDVLGTKRSTPPVGAKAQGPTLQLTILHGDMLVGARAVMVGHYRASRLSGSERVMDEALGGAMSASLGAGVYPIGPGTHKVFMNRARPAPGSKPMPEAVIVVGLGEEGKLQATDLVDTVRNGAIAWAQRVAERSTGAPPAIELAATLIASGGSGVSPAEAAQLCAEGVREANLRLGTIPCPIISHLVLVELYLERAQEAWRALDALAAAAPAHFRLTPRIAESEGGLLRPIDADYRGADHDFVSAVSRDGKEEDFTIAYTVDTKRARSEVHAQLTQARLVEKLVQKSSNDRNNDPRIGRTLFNLLVPVQMRPYLAGSGDTVMELDERTAGIPWELLDACDNGGDDERPWAIRCKVLRKLRTAQFRPQVQDARVEDSVLVIGEPKCGPDFPRLPGARAEARAVAAMLGDPDEGGADVLPLIAPDDDTKTGFEADTIVEALLSRDWRIVHICGHGQPFQDKGCEGGVVLSDGLFLGPREIETMPVVPELVFVNCCHLGIAPGIVAKGRDGATNLPVFAAGVAKKLIDIGVRCVIAAGWAVDDAAAQAFATELYRSLLRRECFMEAVGRARQAAKDMGGNTWAAYQCYGDPDWVFRPAIADGKPKKSIAPGREFGGIASREALVVALQTLATESRLHRKDARRQQMRIRFLEDRFAADYAQGGAVAEAFGDAWAHAGEPERAIACYERAMRAPDGGATLAVADKCGRLYKEAHDSKATEKMRKLMQAALRHSGKVPEPM